MLSELQEKLYAQDRWALLLIFQAMDAAGKDGTIKHVMSGVNPQGCQVYSFKAPSREELDHDFLWRTHAAACPSAAASASSTAPTTRRCSSCACTRSSWPGQKLPPAARHASTSGRSASRTSTPSSATSRATASSSASSSCTSRRRSRSSASSSGSTSRRRTGSSRLGDVQEREHWDDYMKAYEDAIRDTATRRAPWYVVPADHKWFTRLVVAAAIVEALDELDLTSPSGGQSQAPGARQGPRGAA